MSNIIQETVFPGTGLDWDSDQNFIDSGSSPYRLNIMVSGDEANGILTNLMGNSLSIDITDHKLSLSRTYVTIASYYNRLTRKAYYWVFSQPYDSGGGVYIYDNRLFQFNEDEKTLDLIFIDTKNYFDLSLQATFKDSSMLGDWLFFNPRVSEPKMIDVLRAFNYTNYDAWSSTGTYVFGDKITFYGGLFVAKTSTVAGQSPITHPAKWERDGDSYRDETELAFDSEFEYAFNVLKMPPVIRPIISYGSDTHIQVNNVRGKVFRFSYRYKYFDNTYSSYSAFSDITLPEDDEVYNGEILNDITTNNYIKVALNAHSPALVKEVEVVVQEISGDWKRIKIINRQEQAQLTTFDFSVKFYNNESYVTVTNTEVAKVMDFVPKMANSMEIINKNILAYGGCLEGFDNIPKEDIRVGLTPVLESIAIPVLQGATRRDNIASLDITEISVTNSEGNTVVGQRLDMNWLMGSVIEHDRYFITLDGNTEVHEVTAAEAADASLLITNLITFLMSYYAYYDINNRLLAGSIDFLSGYGDPHLADITQSLFCAPGADTTLLTKKRGFKTGANHPFCIYYYDENMRRWDAQVSKENIHIFGLEMHGTTVYVPMFSEVSPPADISNRWLIDWEVYHLPPEGAKYWRWGYAGNSLCSNMIQYIIGANGVVDTDSAVDGANMCKIDITPLQTLKSTIATDWNQFPSSVIDPYVWKQGDRVRFITKESVPGSGTDIGDTIDGVYEYEILKQDGDDLEFIYIQGSVASNGITAAGIGENSLVEIYTPLKSISDTKTIYYEFGDLMPIIEDSVGIMVHAGQNGFHNQDTALSHAALGTFDGGDIYHIMRTPSKPIDSVNTHKGFFHESLWYSDFYDSDSWDRGKIGIETSFGERFLNIVRYSRPYFQNTEINGLSTFEEDIANDWAGYKEYNDVYGDIIAIYEHGNTLKVYQQRKQSSTLIGRTEYEDAQGNITVAISNVVLGAIRWDKSNYSTIFPESISRNNTVIYGFDIINGVAWRDGSNGIFPISGRYSEAGNNSDYKMQTYFKLKSKALMESGIDHISILGVWDEEYKCYYLVFKDSVIQSNNETIVFHEPSNRWITFVDMNQTPLNGFNTPLELSYEVIKGFENGIGYSFNEQTRFAHFNIGGGLGTSAQTPISPATIGLTITVPTPRIQASASFNSQSIGLTLDTPIPLVHVSWITLGTTSMTWLALDSSINDGQFCLLTLVGDGDAWVESTPSWIGVASIHPPTSLTPQILSLGSPVYDGDVLIVYPLTTNSSVDRTGTVAIKDVFDNIKYISVRQDAPVDSATVIVSVNPLEQTGLTVGGGGYADGSTLELSFYVNNPLKIYGETFTLYWVVTRNGVTDTNGQFSVRDEILNTESIALGYASVIGETIIVYLSTVAYGSPTDVINADVYPTTLPLVITAPTPLVHISWITLGTMSMTWTALDNGSSVGKFSTVSLNSGDNARLRSTPSWIGVATIHPPTRLTLLTLSLGDLIYDGDVLVIYPTSANTSLERIGDVVFDDIYDNVQSISVTQDAPLAVGSVSIAMNPSDTTGTTIVGGASVTVGDRNISTTFIPNNPAYGLATTFNMSYEIWKNSTPVASGDFFGVQNRVVNSRTCMMSSDAQVGDVIIIWFKVYQ